MSKKSKLATTLETTPDLSFVKSGLMNMIVHRDQEGGCVRIAADSDAFLEDKRIVKSSTMDQVTFKDCSFKVTLDFLEPIECTYETAVRETTDWMLCSCQAANAFYSKVEKRLVLRNCITSLQSTIMDLEDPFILVLLRDDDEWLVERVLR